MSVREIAAIAEEIRERLDAAQTMIRAAKTVLDEQYERSSRLLEGSAQEVAVAARYRMEAGSTSLDEAHANCGTAIEQLEQLLL